MTRAATSLTNAFRVGRPCLVVGVTINERPPLGTYRVLGQRGADDRAERCGSRS
jgi:hypothetical protein